MISNDELREMADADAPNGSFDGLLADLAAELLTACAKADAGSWLATEIRGHIIILEHCGQADTVTCRELKRFIAAYEATQ